MKTSKFAFEINWPLRAAINETIVRVVAPNFSCDQMKRFPRLVLEMWIWHEAVSMLLTKEYDFISTDLFSECDKKSCINLHIQIIELHN